MRLKRIDTPRVSGSSCREQVVERQIRYLSRQRQSSHFSKFQADKGQLVIASVQIRSAQGTTKRSVLNIK